MPNPGQPTISEGAIGESVRRLQRALNRTQPGSPFLTVDGSFGAQTLQAVLWFQNGQLTPDGVVGPLTWLFLPGGGAMPLLQVGSTGAVVASLQGVLSNNFGNGPVAVDGDFGPLTQAGVETFQQFAGLVQDGVVGDATWQAGVHAAGQTLEDLVGFQYIVN